MLGNAEDELREAIDRILASDGQKKLIVAGPGAGKTWLFRKLLDQAKGDVQQRLVLTFINNLKADLDRSLGDAARVFTLHGYCQHLLHRHEDLRDGLSADFSCYPALPSVVRRDWEWLRCSVVPEFVKLMRELKCPDDAWSFYIERANYYDSVGFDDSVYRALCALKADASNVPKYELVLIDEFQDFNRMEAAVIDVLAERNAIIVAGDDDQALYSKLRGASWDHIRQRYQSGHYEIFELPFCMRCPEVIVGAVNDIIIKALQRKKLQGRIAKPYRYYEPAKREDSRRYPKIELVETTVQRNSANYFGRYIEECIKAISDDDVKTAADKHEPVALIIGSHPYRRQVEAYLVKAGLVRADEEDELSPRQYALELLLADARSNLGWRVVLAEDDESAAKDAVVAAAKAGTSLADHVPDHYRQAVLKEVAGWLKTRATSGGEKESAAPRVKVTSFEGAKGLSAQYVFIAGMHAGEMPRNPAAIEDIEICRFLVGLTRTMKKCCILVTRRFSDKFKKRSEFLSWIRGDRFNETKVDAGYWQR